MQGVRINTPFTDEVIRGLRVGDWVLLSGSVYTGRDAAHRRMVEMLERGESLPFDPSGQAIYYAGPCPAPPGRAIGSVGPTTSQRMDAYTPRLIAEDLRVMIGKGERSEAVVQAIKEHGGIYFSVIGGTGALSALCVESAELYAFADLGPEAIYRLELRDLPMVVSIDCRIQS